MIDDDDVFKAAVLLPSGGRGVMGGIISLASLVIIIALAFAACENKKECAQRKCPTAGQIHVPHTLYRPHRQALAQASKEGGASSEAVGPVCVGGGAEEGEGVTRKSDINSSTIHVPGLRPRSGWIVKSAVEDAWSGPGVGDPDNPGLGHECVYSESKAHVFDDEDEAIKESWTYNCGANVLRVGENGGDRGLREEGCGAGAGRQHRCWRRGTRPAPM